MGGRVKRQRVRVKGLGFRVQGLGFRVWGLGLQASGLTWGGLTMAEKCLMPNIPRLLMVNVPPIISAGASLPSLARPASARTSKFRVEGLSFRA